MERCHSCGGEIDFRYIDGVLRPIHLTGGFCDGGRTTEPTRRHVWDRDSYLNPNALCPVCRKHVYFYQSPYGGRVFFDDVGWPWDKHGCTDTRQSVTPKKPRGPIHSGVLRDRSGARLKIYDLDDIEDRGDRYVFVLRNQMNGYRIRLSASKRWLTQSKVRVADFLDAPSFVVHEFEQGVTHIRFDFICVRLGKVIKMKLRVFH